MGNRLRIGIDLGGTKIECVALDESGAQRFRRRIDTPRDDYAATLDAIVSLVDEAEAATDRVGTVGVGIPGAISPATGLVKNANSTWLIGRPLDRDLGARLGREVRVANDANCFAVSEATDGAAAGARVVFGVILGTGVGGGWVVDGRVLTGVNAIAGEWGHNPLPRSLAAAIDAESGPPCYCGRPGCIETYLSGPGLARDHERVTGEQRSARELAAASDAAAVATLDRYVERLARALAGVINIVDPDVIVLGGGLSQIERLYDDVPRQWRRYVFSDSVATRLLRPRYGDASGVRGAAWLHGA